MRKGLVARNRLFAVFAKKNGAEQARLGLVVSRRVSPKAVIRNRIKRQIRESFRNQQHGLEGLDLVVVAQRSAATASAPALRASLTNHWSKIITTCNGS